MSKMRTNFTERGKIIKKKKWSKDFVLLFGFSYIFSDNIILTNALDVEKGSSNISSAMKYFNSISEYMLQLRQVLEELRDDIE